jgi:hypothetical protein
MSCRHPLPHPSLRHPSLHARAPQRHGRRPHALWLPLWLPLWPAPPAPAPAPEPTPAPAPVRPQATVENLVLRAMGLRLAGEVDKALLIERQIDAMRAREQRVAATEARDVAAKEALARGREAAAKANITARETDVPTRPPVPVAPGEQELAFIPTPGSTGQAMDIQRVAEERAQATSERRGLPVSETAALIEQERQQERERRARTVSAGGVVDEGPTPLLPILAPYSDSGSWGIPGSVGRARQRGHEVP